ncbi:MAG: BrnT family toxin [Betaproteobacteria bacterium]|nr:BrnT family toxin [Roseomonas sp.]
MAKTRFEWDSKKDGENQEKHGVSFSIAQFAFADPRRVIAEDHSHSSIEKRHYCFGLVEGGVLTVRFTYRNDVIRIFGAGYWRKGKQIYERENQIHKRTTRKS